MAARWVVCLALLALLALPRVAQESSAQESSAWDTEQLDAEIERLQGLEGIATDALPEAYDEASSNLARARAAASRKREFDALARSAPGQLEALELELATPPSTELPSADPSAELDELLEALEQAEAQLAQARSERERLEQLSTSRTGRSPELATEIAQAQQTLERRGRELEALPEDATNAVQRLLLATELQALEAEIESLQAERDSLAAQRDLLPLQRDRVQRQINSREKLVAVWQQRVTTKRKSEANDAARTANKEFDEIAFRFPALASLAESNSSLAQLRSGESGLAERIQSARADLARVRELEREVARRFRSMDRRTEVAGLTEGMGVTLRRDYEWLPERVRLRVDAEAYARELSNAQLELIDLEEQRAAVGDLASARVRLLELLGLSGSTSFSEPELDIYADRLLASQRKLQDELINDFGALTSLLHDRARSHALLQAVVSDYRGYIQERILWVRSTHANPLPAFARLPTDATTLVGALGAARVSASELRDRTGSVIALGLLVLGLIAARRPFRRELVRAADLVRSHRTDSFRYTLRALLLTLLLALPLPLLCWTAGWFFERSNSDPVRAFALAAQALAACYFVLVLLKQLVRIHGLAEGHFRWPSRSTGRLRRELRWFTPVALGSGLVALASDQPGSLPWADSVGRTGFLVAMVALTVFLHRLLREKSELLPPGAGILGRTRQLWTTLIVSLPPLLGILALAGYTYTAFQFEARLRYSLAFAVALVLLNALLLRWLFVVRRRLAVAQAREKALARAQAEDEGTAPQSVDEDHVDIPSVDAQTRQLFRSGLTLATVVGLYLIWASALPALQGLNKVQIWPRIAIAAESAPTASPALETPDSAAENDAAAPTPMLSARSLTSAATVRANDELASSHVITLGNVVLALIFVMLTSVMARNIPGLLEISLLQRLPLDGGARYAVATIVRYLILLIGVSAASNALGVGWKDIQWLAAALTFGLAFGLQEIFANFVSGIIILLERPVRVGDLVTVAGTRGRVTRLRMRATTIQDFDRRELLVPNKEFITGSVVNWTLSDPVTRVVIPVGVAYGSDVALTRRLLTEAAQAHPLVLGDPGPRALFRSFGESCLDFELRVFMADPDDWPDLIDQLHEEVERRFGLAGIEIAFPQRDIHIRSGPLGEPGSSPAPAT